VIGAGFGGLALAVRLQSAGIETVLLEARDKPGGRAYVHEAEGFVFDAGPTVVTDPACLAELFALSGRDIADYVELLPVTPFYRLLWEDGTQFDYSNDEAALGAQIAALSPGDVEGYRRFLQFSEGVWREGYLKLGHTAFLDFKQMLAAAPSLARYQAWRSVYDVVASHIRHPKLREALSFHTLLVGGDPFKTSSVYALIHKLEKDGGVWFPRGGTHALVRGLLRLFEDLGGEVRLNAKVERIEAEGARVTEVVTADGWRGRFDAVASNGDVVDTYARLLGHTPRGAAKGRSLKRARFSPSLFVAYFGVRRQYPEVKHHTILFGPRYKGLLRDIYDKGVLAEDFSLYLHHPTATDPAMAPPGCSAFYVLSPVPHLGKAAIDWDAEGPRYRDRILAKLEAQLLPGLRDNLAHVSELTPLGFQRNLSAHLGSAFSLEPILTQSAWFRVHNRDDVLRNLYFVGAGTHPGAGIPGVVGSAKATARVLLADFGLDEVAPTQMRLAAE
jgi:phytoene desaturase